MIKKLQIKIINLLQKIVWKYYSRFNTAEYNARVDLVRAFISDYLPNMDPKFGDKAILEGAKCNYFYITDNNFPTFTFIIPEIPLYVLVGNITTASWDEARSRGILRTDWEKSQSDLAIIQRETPNLSTIGLASKPILLDITWSDSVNSECLLSRLTELFRGE